MHRIPVHQAGWHTWLGVMILLSGGTGFCAQPSSAGMHLEQDAPLQDDSAHRPVALPRPEAVATVRLNDGREMLGWVGGDGGRWLYLGELVPGHREPCALVLRPVGREAVAEVTLVHEGSGPADPFAAPLRGARFAAIPPEEVVLGASGPAEFGAWNYTGGGFSLESSLGELETRRAAAEIERAFAVFRHFFPPRTHPEDRPRFLLAGGETAFPDRFSSEGLSLENPAVFLREQNVVLVGSDWSSADLRRRLIEANERSLREEIERLRAGIDVRVAELTERLRKAPGGPQRRDYARFLAAERRRMEQAIEERQAELLRYQREREAIERQAYSHLLALLRHEAWHAYLENYLFPSARYDVPLWLDEGLAMVFEGAEVDGGYLRADVLSRRTVEGLRAANDESALPVRELLGAGPEAFLDRRPARAARYYAHAGALVHFLLFEWEALEGDRLAAYLAAGEGGADATARFELLVGVPLADFVRHWRRFLARLE